jgi:hypothetical protein
MTGFSREKKTEADFNEGSGVKEMTVKIKNRII